MFTAIQGEKKSGQSVDIPACLEFLKADIRETMVNHLVSSLLQGNPLFLQKFLQNYQAFGTMDQVLDQLLKRFVHHLTGQGSSAPFGWVLGIPCIIKQLSLLCGNWDANRCDQDQRSLQMSVGGLVVHTGYPVPQSTCVWHSPFIHMEKLSILVLTYLKEQSKFPICMGDSGLHLGASSVWCRQRKIWGMWCCGETGSWTQWSYLGRRYLGSFMAHIDMKQ